MKNRIEHKMEQLKKQQEKAFITYMTAGLPDMEGCKELIRAQEEAGTDVLELGIPFSDPVADGPIIQEASCKAIQQGVSLKKVFKMMEEIRTEGVEIPIIFMMYYNTIFYYGLEKFAAECIRCGVDGLIVPDLPLEEQGELKNALKAEHGPILIQSVSPVSLSRVPKILEDARGFVYCVSGLGAAGQSGGDYGESIRCLSAVKAVSPIPVMMGFEFCSLEDVAPVKNVIDGVVSGSHFVRLMEACRYSPKKAGAYCSAFRQQLNALQA